MKKIYFVIFYSKDGVDYFNYFFTNKKEAEEYAEEFVKNSIIFDGYKIETLTKYQ